MEAGVAYAASAFVDTAIAKALAVSELAQIARIEVRLRKMHRKAWNELAAEFTKRATRMLLGKATSAEVVAYADRVFGKYPGKLVKPYNNGIEESYKLSREAGLKKASGATDGFLQYNTPHIVTVSKQAVKVTPSFDLVDTAAVESLKQSQVAWMGTLYNKGIRDNIKAAADKVISEGRGLTYSSRELAKLLANESKTVRMPKGYNGSSDAYFEGVVANGVTNARVQGSLRSFVDLGMTRYEIIAVDDERTCPVCSHMNGKTFFTHHGTKIMEEEVNAKTPAGVKKAHPWLSERQMKTISPKPGRVDPKDSAQLAAAGFALPPFHFRCRCAIDVSMEAGSWEPLPPKEPEPKITAKPKGARKPRTAKPKTDLPGKVGSGELYDMKDSVAPGTFDMGKLQKALESHVDHPRTKRYQVEVRQQLNSLIHKHGAVITDLSNKLSARAKIGIRDRVGVAGCHYAQTGKIDVGRKWAKDAALFNERTKKSIERMTAFEVYVHEALHGASPDIKFWRLPEKQYKAFKLLNEVTTETASRQIMINEFTHVSPIRAKQAFKAYQDEITHIEDSISIAMRKSGVEKELGKMQAWEVRDMLQKTALATKSMNQHDLKDIDSFLDAFAGNLPLPEGHEKLTLARRKKLKDNLKGEFKKDFWGNLDAATKKWK